MNFDMESGTSWRKRAILACDLIEVAINMMDHHFMFAIVTTNIIDSQCDKSVTVAGGSNLMCPNVCEYHCSEQNECESLFKFQSMDRHQIVTNKKDRVSPNTLEHLLNSTKSEENNNEYFTGRELLARQTVKKIQENPNRTNAVQNKGFNFGYRKRSLGCRTAKTVKSICVPPIHEKSTCEENTDVEMELFSQQALKNIDPKMVEMIENEIMLKFKKVGWNKIAGLDYAKLIIKEAVVYPLLRPDIFTGLRRPPKGILLFGPPGTGKTLIGKCIASQSDATFFSISSASLTSKWMGEGEKMVRALFAVAAARQPSVIFMDEIDSLLSKRSESENEGTRRLKTEFLVRLDGATTSDDDRVLIIGATNRPQELDEAVRRRFIKRLYIPLPDIDARIKILANLLNTVDNNLDEEDLKEIAIMTDAYSGADIDSLCYEASMEPLRTLPFDSIMTFRNDNLRPINKSDFYVALTKIRPSVSQSDLEQYVKWNKNYGSS